jgi:outer membrane protein OmpA-like peptidoglycan-associated protein
MNKLAYGVTALTVGGAVALAIDVAVPSSAWAADPSVNWTGPFVGLNAGYAWGDDGVKITGSETGGSGTAHHGLRNPPLPASIPGSLGGHNSGPVAGFQFGYNWQMDRIVVGGIADLDWTDIRSSQTVTIPPDTTSASTKLYPLSTVRARLGYLVSDPLMLYASAGIAIGRIGIAGNIDGIGAQSTSVKVGPAAGAGVEYALDEQWSIFAEYLWYDLPTESVTFTNTTGTATATFSEKFEGNLIRVGFNLRFAPPPPPPPVTAAPPPPPPAPPPPAAPQTFLVFFDFDRATLTPEGKVVIERAAKYAKENGKATIDITGYTDLSGTVAYNMRLSERRAHAVTAYIETLGIPASAIVEAWHGKSNPRVPTPDGVREPQNRRVEIVMP